MDDLVRFFSFYHVPIPVDTRYGYPVLLKLLQTICKLYLGKLPRGQILVFQFLAKGCFSFSTLTGEHSVGFPSGIRLSTNTQLVDMSDTVALSRPKRSTAGNRYVRPLPG